MSLLTRPAGVLLALVIVIELSMGSSFSISTYRLHTGATALKGTRNVAFCHIPFRGKFTGVWRNIARVQSSLTHEESYGRHSEKAADTSMIDSIRLQGADADKIMSLRRANEARTSSNDSNGVEGVDIAFGRLHIRQRIRVQKEETFQEQSQS